ncbi:AraC family transcriptional regulator, partial [Vibrio fortis]
EIMQRDTDSKIAVIAYQCGYKDVSYFSRIFKKRTGVTPASYRRACIDDK